MSIIIFDSEADGLLDEVTKIHCAVTHEVGTSNNYIFVEDPSEVQGGYSDYTIRPLSDLKSVLKESTEIVAHNQISYDLPLFEKLLGIEYTLGPDSVDGSKTKIVDSLVLSRVLNPDRLAPKGCPEKVFNPVTKSYNQVGIHGLLPWSFRVSGEKPQVDDWRDQPLDTYIERCIADVDTNEKVYHALIKEMGDHDWELSVKIAQGAYHLMCKQEKQGIYFDIRKAEELLIVIDDLMEEIAGEVEPQLPLMAITDSNLKKPPKIQFKKDGTPSAHCLRYYGAVEEVKGIWTATDHGIELPSEVPLVTHQTMHMSNQGPIKDWLMSQGWKPTLWNYKKVTKKESQDPEHPYYKMKIGDTVRDKTKPRGKQQIKTTPKIQEQGKLCPNLEAMEGVLAKQVVKWLSLRNRRSVIKSPKKNTGWLNSPRLEIDNRLSAYSTGLTPTKRQKHGGVVNLPKASDSVIMGKEMRSLFIAPPKKILVGYDASAIEGRAEAHSTFEYDNGKYADQILAGDLHSDNCVAFGLMSRGEVDRALEIADMDEGERSEEDLIIYEKWRGARNGGGKWGGGSKGGKYAVTYGCAAAKLASVLNKPEREGKRIYDQFWKTNTALQNLKDDLTAEWIYNKKKKQYKDMWGNDIGWITGIDGGKILIRKESALINFKFQNLGAIVMDLSGIYLDKWLRKRRIDAHRVAYMHDEMVLECFPKDVDLVSKLGCESIVKAGEYLKLKIPLAAAADSGESWAQIH